MRNKGISGATTNTYVVTHLFPWLFSNILDTFPGSINSLDLWRSSYSLSSHRCSSIGQDVNKNSRSSISQNMFPPNPLPMAVPNNPSTRTYNKKIHTSRPNILRYCHDVQSNFQLHLTLWPQKKLTWSSLRTIDKVPYSHKATASD